MSAPPLCSTVPPASPHPLAPATPPRRQWTRAAEHAVLFGEQPHSPRCPPLLHTLTAPRYAVARVLVVPGHAAAQAAVAVSPSLALVASPCHHPCKLRSLALVESPRPPAPATLVCACSPAAVFYRLRFALVRCHMLACTASACMPAAALARTAACVRLFVPSPAWRRSIAVLRHARLGMHESRESIGGRKRQGERKERLRDIYYVKTLSLYRVVSIDKFC